MCLIDTVSLFFIHLVTILSGMVNMMVKTYQLPPIIMLLNLAHQTNRFKEV